MQDRQAESAPGKVGRWLKGLGGATLMVGVGAAVVYTGVRGVRQAEAESKPGRVPRSSVEAHPAEAGKAGH